MIEESRKKETVSCVFEGGVLLETIYDPKEHKTSYITCVNGEYKEHKKIHDSQTNITHEPISSENSLIETRFVKLPSVCLKEKVDVSQLFKEIRQLIETYVKIPEDFLDICTTYVMLTWVHDKFQTIPYLRVIGDYGTGKTTLLRVVGEVCYKAMISSGSVTTAAVFRVIDQFRGTFVFDEADFRHSEMYSDIVKILNSGYSANSPVLRMRVKKDGEMATQSFHVFGPKILGSRMKFGDDALESRNITYRLMPMTKEEINKPAHLDTDFFSRADTLRNKLLSFRFETYPKISADESTLQDIQFPRLRQSALALTSLAKYIGEDVYNSVMKFLVNYEAELKSNQSDNIEADVMVVIIDLMFGSDDSKRTIHLTEISNYFTDHKLAEYSDRAEREYTDKYGNITKSSNYVISPKKIGGIVNRMGIKKSRDGHGFYIDLVLEEKRIIALIGRYALLKYYKEKEMLAKDTKDQMKKNNEILF